MKEPSPLDLLIAHAEIVVDHHRRQDGCHHAGHVALAAALLAIIEQHHNVLCSGKYRDVCDGCARISAAAGLLKGHAPDQP